MSKSQRTLQLELPALSLAKIEIAGLASDPELTKIYILGRGQLTDEQKAENLRREELRTSKWLAIIKKHGVQEEYLKPLIEKRDRLWSELTEVCRVIEAIQA